jgi:phytoene dehydrogenase-like protein
VAPEYDAIVIGGGPNGLTCSAYLAKAGLRILLLDKKHEFGGGLYTEDMGTPFRFNAHAIYMLLAELMPPHQDLELEAKGVDYIRPPAQVSFLHRDGKALVFYTDPARSAESVRQFDHQDADTFERMYAEFKEMCDEALIPATYVPPLPVVEQVELLEKTELGRRISEISEWSPREIVDSYEFRDPRVQGAILHLATMWGIHPDVGGVGFMVPLYIYRMMNAALVRGGTHGLASALYANVRAGDTDIVEWAEVDRIITENGTATGVGLTDGREFQARAVVSTLNPEQTFLELIGKEGLSKELAATLEGWEWEEWSLFTSHLGIKGEAPHYTAAEFNPDVDSALTNFIGIESPDDVMGRIAEIEAGRLPEPAGGGMCVSVHDPLQASAGPYGPLHTLRWESHVPYALADGDWDDVKQDYADRCFEAWKEYAPNLGEAKVLFNFVYSPRDIERRLTSMQKGSIKHGAYTSMQMGYLRPTEDCSSYRTPIKGLYVAGASTHPGGMVILGPGYNAAKVVTEDLGGNVWWSPPDYVVQAREKQYLAAE